MLKTIFLTLSVIFFTISCSSFAKIYTKKDPNKFYFDDYIDGKNFKHEEAEKQFLKVFPIGSDVDEVMKKIQESEKGWSCYYNDAWKHYGCTKKNGFMNYGSCSIVINRRDKDAKNHNKLKTVKFFYTYHFLDV